MTSPLVLCPLAIERKAFARFGKAAVQQFGWGAARMQMAMDRLAQGRLPSLVVLFGTAGGLDHALPQGTAYLITSVASSDPSLPTIEAPALPSKLLSEHKTARVVESATIVSTPEARNALAAQSGAQLVDMEAYTFAQCAIAMNLPWAVVRCVSDGAGETLIPELASILNQNGDAKLGTIITSILRRPSLLPQLYTLQRQTNFALKNGAFLADALCCAHEEQA
ncbi:MAG: hypothetical protein DWH96_04635 [Planctomycetota bacterium]|nr:MAG: hypothetical protein DWH96_04635 [Planctomycetota bacterium]RLS92792.1 MAG: hypothetical protein DWI11_08250 [Planctomycetota bacterium]